MQTHVFDMSRCLCDRDFTFIFTVLLLNLHLLCQTFLNVSVKMLVQVKYSQQQKYVQLNEVEEWFGFLQFHEKGLLSFGKKG